jgi:hypothetical protein
MQHSSVASVGIHPMLTPSSAMTARSGQIAISFRGSPELFTQALRIYNHLDWDNHSMSFKTLFPKTHNPLIPTTLVVRNSDIVKETFFANEFLRLLQGIFTTSPTGSVSGLHSLEVTYTPNSENLSIKEQQMLGYFNRNVIDTRFGVDVSSINSGFKVVPSRKEEGFLQRVARPILMKLKKLVFYNQNNPNKEVFITSGEARLMVLRINCLLYNSPALKP